MTASWTHEACTCVFTIPPVLRAFVPFSVQGLGRGRWTQRWLPGQGLVFWAHRLTSLGFAGWLGRPCTTAWF